jgi:hypothetical protein
MEIFHLPQMFPVTKKQPLGCDSGHTVLWIVRKPERSEFVGGLVCCAVMVKWRQRHCYETILGEECAIREREITHRLPEESHWQMVHSLVADTVR